MSRVDPQTAVSQQGHYAGAVTRLVAFVIDQTIVTAVYTAGSAAVVWIISLVTSIEIDTALNKWLALFGYAIWWFIYFAYPWSVSGKTPGMALLGIRVVQADGSWTTARNGVLRALAFPLSFLLFGLGFLGILTGRERRALHDHIARTAVVYAWDAWGARLRFLARQGTDDPEPDPVAPEPEPIAPTANPGAADTPAGRVATPDVVATPETVAIPDVVATPETVDGHTTNMTAFSVAAEDGRNAS